MIGLAAIDVADVLAFVGYGWAFIPGGFIAGFYYLRMRTLSESVF